MSNDMVPAAGGALAAKQARQFDLSPTTFEQALTFANYLAESDMVPKQYRGKPGDCLIAMQWGFEVGLKPLQALQNIAAINGKPSLYGDAGKALLLSNGCDIDEDDIAIVEKNKRARCKISRPGRTPVERTFSVENAQTAGLWGKDGPWRAYPWRQMAWRAFWFAARDAASDILRGMNGFEEVLDMQMSQAPTPTPTAIEVVPQMYSADKFEQNLAGWHEVIASGRKTADQMIAMVETKGALTDEQKQRIRTLPAAEVTQQTEEQAAE